MALMRDDCDMRVSGTLAVGVEFGYWSLATDRIAKANTRPPGIESSLG
jgi:hypothetical protein